MTVRPEMTDRTERLRFELVATGHPARATAEAFVRAIYAERYGAVVHVFPETLAVLTDANGDPACVAGVRFGLVECFSEQYLDLPIELALREATGRAADRRQILEVTTLASDRRASPLQLVDAVVSAGRALGMGWGVFTATRPLRAALRRAGIELIELAPARQDRIASAGDWGSYYETDPWVCAVVDQVPVAVAAGDASAPVVPRLVADAAHG